MLKIKTKFRCIVGIYMAIPLLVMIGYTRDTPLFHNPDFQGALGVSLAVGIFMALCSPLLLGLRWIFLGQLTHVTRVCSAIRNGKYHFFTLPNEPSDDSGENEMVALMRDMNWMVRQIQHRETELEDRVCRRTEALEKANTALTRARDAADASARAKSEFLTTMSHEIRTPMNAIINLSGLALKKSRDHEQSARLEIIHSSSSALLGIINDILDFSKINAGKLVLETIPLNVRDLFEEIMDMFNSQLSDSPVELLLDIDPAIPATILTDPLRLRQILTNLISNAVKFTSQGEIIIRAALESQTPDHVVLSFSVQDTGVGISPEALDTLFTPFTQEDGSTTRKYGGTGLGLAISQKLAGLMGGSITAVSTKGEGTCFSFSITAAPVDTESLSSAGLPAHFRNQQVRVIIENPKAEEIIITYLQAFGLTATGRGPWTPGGKCPFGQLFPESDPCPSLVVLDADMAPGICSSVVDQVRTMGKIPIIALGRPARQADGQPDWAAAFVPKPAKQSMLFDALMDVVNSEAAAPFGTAQPLQAKVFTRDLDILVVEDNLINQTVAKEVFTAMGIHPVIVSGGREALDRISSQNFDAVIMDVQMPEMDGYEATRKIREIGYHDLPVIAMTANAMDEDREKGLAAGMTAYITKPVDPDRLFATLSDCLGIRPAGKSLPERPAAPDSALPATGPEDLPGFDLKDAMKRLNNNLDLFKELIRQFYADNKEMPDLLENLTADPAALKEELHRIKGTCASLSASGLLAAVADLDALAKTDRICPDAPETKGSILRIRREMAVVARTALGLSREAAPPPSPDAEIPPDIMDRMQSLGRLLEENSLSAKAFSKDLAAQLSGTPLRARACRLESQIKRFEFSKARQTFTDLTAELDAITAKTA